MEGPQYTRQRRKTGTEDITPGPIALPVVCQIHADKLERFERLMAQVRLLVLLIAASMGVTMACIRWIVSHAVEDALIAHKIIRVERVVQGP